MSIPADFPTIFSDYNVEISFSDEKEKSSLIEAIAERVSSIYASLLQEETYFKVFKVSKEESKETSSSVDFRYHKSPEKFPPKKEVENFQKDLKQAIIDGIQLKPFIVNLKNDYAPEKILYDMLCKNGITGSNYQIERFFPHKSYIDIDVRSSIFIKIKCTHIR